MSRISCENYTGGFSIVNRLTYPESVNERLCNAINTGMIDGIFPVNVQKSRKDTRLVCLVSGPVPILQYFSGVVKKEQFLDFACQIARLIKGCEKNMMSANNLDLQNDRIFFDPFSGKVQCIYWPVVNNQSERLPGEYLKRLPSMFYLDPNEDCKYLQTYASFFYGIEPFSVNNFEKMILTLQGKGSEHGDSDSGAGNYKNVEKKSESIEYDPFSSYVEPEPEPKQEQIGEEDKDHVICPLCGTVNKKGKSFCEDCGGVLDGSKVSSAPTINYSSAKAVDADPAGILNSEVIVPELKVKEAKLTMVRTGAVFSFVGPSVLLGKDSSRCTVCIWDNSFVSRVHAEIFEDNGRFFIVDRRSTNSTYVENQQIYPDTPVELFDGTRFSLSSEEFVFNLN